MLSIMESVSALLAMADLEIGLPALHARLKKEGARCESIVVDGWRDVHGERICARGDLDLSRV